MKKIYKAFMIAMQVIIGILVLSCAGILLYASRNDEETESLPPAAVETAQQTEESAEDFLAEELSDAEYVTPKEPVTPAQTQTAEQQTQIEQTQTTEQQTQTEQAQEQQEQNPKQTESDSGLLLAQNEEPQAEETTQPTGNLLGTDLVYANDCVQLLGCTHGSTFQETMNQVLRRAGITQDITAYEGVVYNTTADNSTYGDYGIYDNVEISSRMGEYRFAELPVRLHLKFDHTIWASEGENNEAEKWNAKLTGVRVVFKKTEENIRSYTEGEALREQLTAVLGQPTQQTVTGSLHKYEWQVGADTLSICYKPYEIEENKESVTYWFPDYLDSTHNSEE